MESLACKIKEINLEEGYVVASWDHNPPRKYYARKGKFGWFKSKMTQKIKSITDEKRDFVKELAGVARD